MFESMVRWLLVLSVALFIYGYFLTHILRPLMTKLGAF